MNRKFVQAGVTTVVLLTIVALLLIKPDFNFGGNPGDEALKVILKADTNARNLGESLNHVSLVSYQADIQGESESQPDYVRASDSLKEAWDARYKQAVEDYEQMIADIEEAEEVAREYFDIQRA